MTRHPAYPLYVLCEDPDCPQAFGYRAPFPAVPHYHYRPLKKEEQESEP